MILTVSLISGRVEAGYNSRSMGGISCLIANTCAWHRSCETFPWALRHTCVLWTTPPCGGAGNSQPMHTAHGTLSPVPTCTRGQQLYTPSFYPYLYPSSSFSPPTPGKHPPSPHMQHEPWVLRQAVSCFWTLLTAEKFNGCVLKIELFTESFRIITFMVCVLHIPCHSVVFTI